REVLDPEARGGAAGHGDPPAVHVEASEQPARRDGGVVQREEAEPEADVEDLAPIGEVLSDLVEKALAQDPEPRPAVRAHDGIVVRLDDPKDLGASHRSGTRRRRGRDGTGWPATGPARGSDPGDRSPHRAIRARACAAFGHSVIARRATASTAATREGTRTLDRAIPAATHANAASG